MAGNYDEKIFHELHNIRMTLEETNNQLKRIANPMWAFQNHGVGDLVEALFPDAKKKEDADAKKD